MLTVCPSCRHTFPSDVHHPPCSPHMQCSMPVVVSATIRIPSMCSSGINCTVNFNSAGQVHTTFANNQIPLSKQELIRNTLSGGDVIRTDKDYMFGPDFDNDEKPDDNNDRNNHNHNHNNNNNNNNNNKKLDGCKMRGQPVEAYTYPPYPLKFYLPKSVCKNFTSFVREVDRLMLKTYTSPFMTSIFYFNRLAVSLNFLHLSGWYHKDLSWKDAIRLLMPTAVGTFLVRNSSDRHFLFSLSIQTKCGPTSIRINYFNGEFALDAEPHVDKFMPRFPCVLKLIQYYVEATTKQPLRCFHSEMRSQFWDEDQGHPHAGQLYSHVTVDRPLHVKGVFPSLKHLCRLAVNRHFPEENDIRNLPTSLITYVRQYPHVY